MPDIIDDLANPQSFLQLGANALRILAADPVHGNGDPITIGYIQPAHTRPRRIFASTHRMPAGNFMADLQAITIGRATLQAMAERWMQAAVAIENVAKSRTVPLAKKAEEALQNLDT